MERKKKNGWMGKCNDADIQTRSELLEKTDLCERERESVRAKESNNFFLTSLPVVPALGLGLDVGSLSRSFLTERSEVQ